MARILFNWEMGAGMGHIAPYLETAKQLVSAGHEVFFVMKELQRAERFFHGTGVKYLQAPCHPDFREGLKTSALYAQILHNCGFSSVDITTSLINAWRGLFDLIKPDLMVFDHAPVAQLASRELGVKRAVFGTGFQIPPEDDPMPLMPFWNEVDEAAARKDEAQVLNVINQSLTAAGMQSVERVGQIFEVDLKLLCTFRELDHYGQRNGMEFIGVGPDPVGADPKWPKMPGRRLFGYLKPFKTLPDLLKVINENELPTLIYPDGISHKVMKKFGSKNLHFVKRPLDMGKVCQQCDVALTNGNHATTATLLLHGVPSLVLPRHHEQYMVGERVQALGAGLSAPKLHPDGMKLKLKALCEDGRYKQAAMAFAEKYSDFDRGGMSSLLTERLTALL